MGYARVAAAAAAAARRQSDAGKCVFNHGRSL